MQVCNSRQEAFTHDAFDFVNLLVAENLLHYMLQGMIDLSWEVARVYII